jgi:hypothetical protein
MIEHWIARHGSARLLGRIGMVSIVAMALLLRASAAPAAKKEAASPDAHEITAFIDKRVPRPQPNFAPSDLVEYRGEKLPISTWASRRGDSTPHPLCAQLRVMTMAEAMEPTHR